MFVEHLSEGGAALARIAEGDLGRPAARSEIERLGATLARRTRAAVWRRAVPRAGDRPGVDPPGGRAAPRVLCAIVLRGGALLYPGFAEVFRDADFCLLGLQRGPDGRAVECRYVSPLGADRYDLAIFVDTIVGTGGTLVAARRVLEREVRLGASVAAVLCAARPGTERLAAEGFGVIGFSLEEDERDGLVLPDLGALDAGDVFARGDR